MIYETLYTQNTQTHTRPPIRHRQVKLCRTPSILNSKPVENYFASRFHLLAISLTFSFQLHSSLLFVISSCSNANDKIPRKKKRSILVALDVYEFNIKHIHLRFRWLDKVTEKAPQAKRN